VIYPLLSWLGDVPVGFKKRANVDGLAAPEVSMYRPVESKLQGAPIEGAVGEGGPDQQLSITRQQPALQTGWPAVEEGPVNGGGERGAHRAACREDMAVEMDCVPSLLVELELGRMFRARPGSSRALVLPCEASGHTEHAMAVQLGRGTAGGTEYVVRYGVKLNLSPSLN
jgi:hypothetical protein